MPGGFGRKGVVGEAAAPRSFGAPAMRAATPGTSAPDGGLSPEARAFIAAERVRRAESLSSSDPVRSDAPVFRTAPKAKPARTMLVAYVLWWWGAAFAAHRFYLGAYRSGAAMTGLFWGGLALGSVMSKKSSLWIGSYAVPPFWAAMVIAWMLWCLVDAFLIPGLMRRYRAERQTEGLAHVFA